MKSSAKQLQPGPIALFGSGEKSPHGRKVFQHLLEDLPDKPQISLLETPAGFELNSSQVAGEIAEFLEHHLQNFHPQTHVIPARKKGQEWGPDNPKILTPLLKSELIFMGPGSPSYAVRQLKDSLAWAYIRAAHRAGTALALASASSIAASSYALPVYQIYKVGTDLHWLDGLDLLGSYQLPLVLVPHWNNQEGGETLDTSRCFMGRARFQPLLELLPPLPTVVGIDEHTGLILNLAEERCQVVGIGDVTLIRDGSTVKFPAETTFSIAELGPFHLPTPELNLDPQIWEKIRRHQGQKNTPPPDPPQDIIRKAEQRQQAREEGDWDRADELRAAIEERGWKIQDSQDDYHLKRPDPH